MPALTGDEMTIRIASLIISILIFVPGAAQAWWEDGHVIVAKVAEAHLSQEARAAIKDLLPRATRRDPGTAGTVAAPQDQELRPVPSETVNGARVPIGT